MAVRKKLRAETAMVDISSKEIVHRTAVAEGSIRLTAKSMAAIRQGGNRKGDVLTIAELAGISAAKKTYDLIPLCHQIPLNHVTLKFRVGEKGVGCTATVEADWKTGVEMEALTAVSVALLTVWDMVKRTEKDSRGQYRTAMIERISVVRKEKVKTSGSP